jgi:hypothetical protein
MEAGGYFHITADLASGKEPEVPIVGLIARLDVNGVGKYPLSWGNQALVVQIVASHCNDSNRDKSKYYIK